MNWYSSQIHILESIYNVITGENIKKPGVELSVNTSDRENYSFILDTKNNNCKDSPCDLKQFLINNKEARSDSFEDNASNFVANAGLDLNGSNRACKACTYKSKIRLLLNKLMLANLECDAWLQNYNEKESSSKKITVFFVDTRIVFFGLMFVIPDEAEKAKGYLCIETANKEHYILAELKKEIKFVKLNSFTDEYNNVNYVLGVEEIPKDNFKLFIIELDRLFHNTNYNKTCIYEDNIELFNVEFDSYSEILKGDNNITEFYMADIRREAKKGVAGSGSFQKDTKTLLSYITEYMFYIKIAVVVLVIGLWKYLRLPAKEVTPRRKISIL